MFRWPVTLIVACLFPVSQAHATAAGLTGVWAMKWCDNDPSHECGGFYLYLVQKGDRICGSFYATLNAGRLNEGAPRSVVGTLSGSTAIVSIQSGRDNSFFRAKATRAGNKLDWRILEKLKAVEGDEPLIPEKAHLAKMEGRMRRKNSAASSANAIRSKSLHRVDTTQGFTQSSNPQAGLR